MTQTNPIDAKILDKAIQDTFNTLGSPSKQKPSTTLREGSVCPGQANPFPIYEGNPVLVKQVENGSLYKVGTDDNTISIVHVYGTPTQKGKAYGLLLGEEIKNCLDAMNTYLVWFAIQEIKKYVPALPDSVLSGIVKAALSLALDAEIALTKSHTPQYFRDQVQAVADASGVSYDTLFKLQMLPELIKAACSMIGAWGDASKTGSVVQMRALDFDIQMPMHHYPLITVDHATNDAENTFMTLGWVGFFGGITGTSTANAICEKYCGVGKTQRSGIPFNILLTDILRNDRTIADSFKRLQDAVRTCSIFIGVGTREDQQFRSYRYCVEPVTEFNWNTPFPAYAPQSAQHPNIENVVYIDRHVQPSGDACLATAIQDHKAQGGLDAKAMMDICGLHQSGDSHILITDFANNAMYAAVADPTIVWSPDKTQTRTEAYKRQFIKLDMNIFATPN